MVYIIYGIIAFYAGLPVPSIWFYTPEMLDETRELFRFWFNAILVIILVEFFWKEYNRLRFGRLDRRTMPVDTTDEEMAEIFGITPEEVSRMKSEKVVVFEENVI